MIDLLEKVKISPHFTANIYSHRVLANLSNEEEDRIYNTLIEVSSRSFGADQTGFWNSKKNEFNYLRNLTYFVFVCETKNDKIVGWTGIRVFKLKKLTVCYLDSTGIVPEYYGNAAVPKANAIITKRAFLKRPYFDFVMFSRTENPVVYKALAANLGFNNVYPQMDGSPYPSKYKEAVKLIINYLNQQDLLNYDTLIIKNAYGYLDELYGTLPKCSNKNINDFFNSRLSSNDAFLIMAVLNYKQLTKLIM